MVMEWLQKYVVFFVVTKKHTYFCKILKENLPNKNSKHIQTPIKPPKKKSAQTRTKPNSASTKPIRTEKPRNNLKKRARFRIVAKAPYASAHRAVSVTVYKHAQQEHVPAPSLNCPDESTSNGARLFSAF